MQVAVGVLARLPCASSRSGRGGHEVLPVAGAVRQELAGALELEAVLERCGSVAAGASFGRPASEVLGFLPGICGNR